MRELFRWFVIGALGYTAWRYWRAAQTPWYEPPQFYRVEEGGAVEPIGQALASAGQAVTDFLEGLGIMWQLPERAAPYAAQIRAAELRYGLPENLLARLLYQESRFRPDIISGATRSSAGALGIAQFMPATAAELGIDPLDPGQAIDGAARYLARLYARFGNWAEALAAYNWGQGNVARKGLEVAPLETRNYLREILGDLGMG